MTLRSPSEKLESNAIKKFKTAETPVLLPSVNKLIKKDTRSKKNKTLVWALVIIGLLGLVGTAVFFYIRR